MKTIGKKYLRMIDKMLDSATRDIEEDEKDELEEEEIEPTPPAKKRRTKRASQSKKAASQPARMGILRWLKGPEAEKKEKS